MTLPMIESMVKNDTEIDDTKCSADKRVLNLVVLNIGRSQSRNLVVLNIMLVNLSEKCYLNSIIRDLKNKKDSLD